MYRYMLRKMGSVKYNLISRADKNNSSVKWNKKIYIFLRNDVHELSKNAYITDFLFYPLIYLLSLNLSVTYILIAGLRSHPPFLGGSGTVGIKIRVKMCTDK